MEKKRKKIELSTVHFDANEKPIHKSVHFDVEYLATKNIRSWDDKTGRLKTDYIVLYDKPTDKDYIVLNMSREAYLKLMKEIGAIEVL